MPIIKKPNFRGGWKHGYNAGLQAAAKLSVEDKPMRQAVIDRMIKNQSTVAKKVYESVPNQEPWEIKAIVSDLGRRQHHIDYKRVCGCLNSMKESGLIKEPFSGSFIRVVASTNPVHVPIEELQQMADTSPKVLTIKKKTRDPMDIISGLTTQMRELADKFDEAALELADTIATSGADTDKLRALKALLKAVQDE